MICKGLQAIVSTAIGLQAVMEHDDISKIYHKQIRRLQRMTVCAFIFMIIMASYCHGIEVTTVFMGTPVKGMCVPKYLNGEGSQVAAGLVLSDTRLILSRE